MLRRSKGISVALTCLCVCACGGGGGGGGGTPTTLFMVYIAGDNNLDEAAVADLNEMEAVGSSANVTIAVQVDTMTVPVAGSVSAKRMRVVPDADPVNVTSPVLENLGEIDTASAAQIVAFVNWAVSNFPADRYCLVLWDHGGGWVGFATDDTSGSSVISAIAIQQALEDARVQSGIARFDIVGFDACLMATVEVAHEIASEARYMVASEEIEPGAGWPYDEILGPLVANPGMSMRTFAASIPALYEASMSAAGEMGTTQSAIDLDRVGAVVGAVDGLEVALLNAGVPVQYEGLGRARFKTDKYQTAGDDPSDSARTLVDLGDLVAKIEATAGIPAPVLNAVNGVQNALAQAVVASESGPLHAEAEGLSVYFSPVEVDLGYGGLAFALDSEWDEFLDTFVAESVADVIAPSVVIDQSANLDGPTVVSPATLDLTITGSDVIDLQAWVLQDQGGGFVDIMGAVDQQEAQPGPGQVTWDGDLIGLTDGLSTSALPLFPVEPGACEIAIGFARYRASALSPDRDLLMVVDCSTGSFGFFDFVETAAGTLIAPIQLADGSEFEVLFIRLDTNTDTAELVPGITLTLANGGDSLALTFGGATSGTYALAAIVEDIAGNQGVEGVEVTIP